MSAPTHTPGPWRIEPEEHAAVILCDSFVVADVYYEAGVNAGASTKEEALANANLIASAPDLLSALQECVRVLAEHTQYDDDDGSAEGNARLIGLAAISKAEGEA